MIRTYRGRTQPRKSTKQSRRSFRTWNRKGLNFLWHRQMPAWVSPFLRSNAIALLNSKLRSGLKSWVRNAVAISKTQSWSMHRPRQLCHPWTFNRRRSSYPSSLRQRRWAQRRTRGIKCSLHSRCAQKTLYLYQMILSSQVKGPVFECTTPCRGLR